MACAHRGCAWVHRTVGPVCANCACCAWRMERLDLVLVDPHRATLQCAAHRRRRGCVVPPHRACGTPARRSLKRRLCTAEHLRTRERRCGGQPRHSTDTPPSPQRYPDSAACCLRAGSSARARARMRWDGAVRRSALSRGAKPTAKADGRVVHASHGIFHVAVAAAIAVQRLAAILRGQSATAAPCAMEHAWL
jgi:hypothetical protein